MVPIFVVTGLPTTVRYDEDWDATGTNGSVKVAKIFKEPDFLGDRFDERIGPPAF
jgi:hypothetical protein